MEKTTLALLALGVVGVVWWFSRPVAAGTQINAVAGLRG